MVLKGDSSILNGCKPLFIPEWTEDMRFTPALAVRISRLGRNIEARFADRYYDAVAPAIDYVAYDRLCEAQAEGRPWSEATGFDFSLAVGPWQSIGSRFEWRLDEEAVPTDAEWTSGVAEAIERVSQVMTLRQGDILYITPRCAPRAIHIDQCIHVLTNKNEILYTRIK